MHVLPCSRRSGAGHRGRPQLWGSAAAGPVGHVWCAAVLTAEALAARQEEIHAAPDLSALLRRLTERAVPVIQRMPPIPTSKALLTADGGTCPDDGTRLEFDPWSPAAHRCPRCGKPFTG